jgi:hypothetical protein
MQILTLLTLLIHKTMIINYLIYFFNKDLRIIIMTSILFKI